MPFLVAERKHSYFKFNIFNFKTNRANGYVTFGAQGDSNLIVNFYSQCNVKANPSQNAFNVYDLEIIVNENM